MRYGTRLQRHLYQCRDIDEMLVRCLLGDGTLIWHDNILQSTSGQAVASGKMSYKAVSQQT